VNAVQSAHLVQCDRQTDRRAVVFILHELLSITDAFELVFQALANGLQFDFHL